MCVKTFKKEKRKMKRTNKKGFTVVELIVVIAVIAVLAAVLIPKLSSMIDDANESAAIREADSALREDLVAASGDYTKIVDTDTVDYKGAYAAETKDANATYTVTVKTSEATYTCVFDIKDGKWTATK